MNEQLQFLEHMNAIAQLGKEHNGIVTKEEVMKELGDTPFNDAQWDVMGEFLFSRQVRLEGYTPTEVQEEKPAYEFSIEEQNFMKYYEADLDTLIKKTDEELEEILKQMAQGQAEAANVYNMVLPKIYEIAKAYANGKEQLGDLVQEANLRAFTLLEELTVDAEETMLESMEKEIRLTLKSYIAEDADESLEIEKIAGKLNQMVEAVEALKEQNADYSIEDISDFLEIPVEEIDELLRIAGEN